MKRARFEYFTSQFKKFTDPFNSGYVKLERVIMLFFVISMFYSYYPDSLYSTESLYWAKETEFIALAVFPR